MTGVSFSLSNPCIWLSAFVRAVLAHGETWGNTSPQPSHTTISRHTGQAQDPAPLVTQGPHQPGRTPPYSQTCWESTSPPQQLELERTKVGRINYYPN
ncbi:hypothetical protein ATANTOWER_031302 [Ataeniobius toweri]|uniref:Secreted protein n=1 Tax=Ataeniobius toweri TaxID=208326 RepID=A0ABU7C4F6_9TELE|nr:hypothetical protein [Ataeniobius toweri]